MSIELLRPDWPAPARVQALCTGRQGGTSIGAWNSLNLGVRSGDDLQAVARNRQLLVEQLRLPSMPVWLNQVHGTDVVKLPAAEAEPVADASFTVRSGVVCTVLMADCLPVLFCDDAASVVAAAHAGWRGLAAGVLEETIRALQVPPAGLMAWLGPAIGPEAFEVGREVLDAFTAHDEQARAAFRPSTRTGHYYADLFLLARQRLAASGLTRIHGGGISTHADAERYFSHRRDQVSGRQAALIWLSS
jgi:YfiH family protein